MFKLISLWSSPFPRDRVKSDGYIGGRWGVKSSVLEKLIYKIIASYEA